MQYYFSYCAKPRITDSSCVTFSDKIIFVGIALLLLWFVTKQTVPPGSSSNLLQMFSLAVVM